MNRLIESVPLLSLKQYEDLDSIAHTFTPAQLEQIYWLLARADRWFLVRYVLFPRYFENVQMNEQWIMDRCRETQRNSNKVVDIWSRFHWKSNIKTTAGLIQAVLNDFDMTTVIFSHVRPMAKSFLAQIQREVTSNDLLKRLSWDPLLDAQIFPDDPNDLERNSLDDGIIVNRLGNPREGTFEAYGYDSLPTSKHYRIRCGDDVSVLATVTTPEQKAKAVTSWRHSQPLGMPTGGDEEWNHGTFYAYDDLYHTMEDAGYEMRIHPMVEIDQEGTTRDEDGKIIRMKWHEDKPVLYELERLLDMANTMGRGEGSEAAMMQLYCDPSVGTGDGLKLEWLQYYDEDPKDVAKGCNLYLLVDPSGGRNKMKGCKTSMWVVALGRDGNKYIVDFIYDRLNLPEKTRAVFLLHRSWRPIQTRYESYSMQADTGHIKEMMATEHYRFKITEVSGNTPKPLRISRLVPGLEAGQYYFPRKLMKTLTNGDRVDVIKQFVNDEYIPYPQSAFDDGLDGLARIEEPGLRLIWPEQKNEEKSLRHRRYRPKPADHSSWLTA